MSSIFRHSHLHDPRISSREDSSFVDSAVNATARPLHRLSHSLYLRGFDQDDVDEAIATLSLGANTSAELSERLTASHLKLELSELPADLQERVTGTIEALSGNSASEASEIIAKRMEEGISAIFAYGTLRADYNKFSNSAKVGDKWGVTRLGLKGSESGSRKLGCSWEFGRVRGFELYQQPNLYYPFAMCTSNTSAGSSSVFGTILSWPEDNQTFIDAVKMCNQIEGYNPDSKFSLYKRAVVKVRTVNNGTTVLAYMYFQQPDRELLRECTKYEHGDWADSFHEHGKYKYEHLAELAST